MSGSHSVNEWMDEWVERAKEQNIALLRFGGPIPISLCTLNE